MRDSSITFAHSICPIKKYVQIIEDKARMLKPHLRRDKGGKELFFPHKSPWILKESLAGEVSAFGPHFFLWRCTMGTDEGVDPLFSTAGNDRSPFSEIFLDNLGIHSEP